MIRIYIADLGAYNAGFLKGRWLELPMDIDELQIELKSMNCEEIAIHDYECDFMEVSEYDSINVLNELAEIVSNNVVKAILEHEGLHYWKNDIDGLVNHADTANLISDVSNHEELGQYLVSNDYIDVPEHIEPYFDYEAYGRDYDLNSSGGFTSYGYLSI